MFKSEEDVRRERVVILVVVVVAVMLVGSVFMVQKLWREFGPLPNIPECKALGYKAGAIEYGTKVCYDDCATNNIRSCTSFLVVT